MISNRTMTQNSLTATPNANACVNESPNIIPTKVDDEPRHEIDNNLSMSFLLNPVTDGAAGFVDVDVTAGRDAQ